MDGAQIGFGPWRSNLRKSSTVNTQGLHSLSKCTIVRILLLCIALLQILMQIDISIRISNLILYNSSEFSGMDQSKCSLRRPAIMI